jgi:hypothetical protein
VRTLSRMVSNAELKGRALAVIWLIIDHFEDIRGSSNDEFSDSNSTMTEGVYSIKSGDDSDFFESHPSPSSEPTSPQMRYPFLYRTQTNSIEE